MSQKGAGAHLPRPGLPLRHTPHTPHHGEREREGKTRRREQSYSQEVSFVVWESSRSNQTFLSGTICLLLHTWRSLTCCCWSPNPRPHCGTSPTLSHSTEPRPHPRSHCGTSPTLSHSTGPRPHSPTARDLAHSTGPLPHRGTSPTLGPKRDRGEGGVEYPPLLCGATLR